MGERINLSMWLAIITLLLYCTNKTKADVAEDETFIITRLISGQPIITEAMFEALGATTYESYNINGPSVIRVPDWIAPGNRADPNATYYICLLYTSPSPRDRS